LCPAQCLGRREPVFPEILVEGGDEPLGGCVFHLPQAGQHGSGPGHLEGPLEAKEPLPIGHLAQPGFTCREHDQLCTAKIEFCHLQGSEDAFVGDLSRPPVGRLRAAIGPGQGDAREQPRVYPSLTPLRSRVSPLRRWDQLQAAGRRAALPDRRPEPGRGKEAVGGQQEILSPRESEHLAERLIRETVLKEGIVRDQLTIHSDRGPSMRSQTVAQLLATLGITLLTPATVHYGQADAALAARQAVLTAAHVAHPERFVRQPPRPLALPGEVWINPPADGPEPRMLQLPRDTNFVPQLSQTG